MNRDIGASLRIRIKITDHCEIKFEYEGKRPLIIKSELSLHQLSQERDELRSDLDEFINNLRDTVTQRSLSYVGEVFHNLHFRGRSILYKLFGSNTDNLRRAVEICRKACPGWEYPMWKKNSFMPRRIVVRSEVDYGIPLDMLPLFNPLKPKKIETMEDFAHATGSLLGFSAIVQREIGPIKFRKNYIENIPLLSMKMFQNRGLPGSRKDEKFFKDNNAFIDLDGPWPDSKSPADKREFSAILAKYLWNPGKSFEGGLRHPSDQIYYFSCHCDTTARHSGKYVLQLQHGELWGKREVELETLLDELNQLKLKHNHYNEGQSQPLIFMNACGSANFDPAGAGSWPKLFLSNDWDAFLGFIGTEASIPDTFSNYFVEAFYRYFLGGLTLGQSIHAARWEMLRWHKNPLSILYSLYAHPEIRVRKPIKEFSETWPVKLTYAA